MLSGLSPLFASTIQTAFAYANTWRAAAAGEETEQGADMARPSGKTRAGELDPADQRRVEEMKATDRAVRAHEAAHMAAGGNLVTSGASYTYETGPDGQRYAVAGEVGIDTSEGRTPEETLMRAERVRAAALAPADPSAQDRAVAAAAAQMAAEARAEIARANMEESKSGAPREAENTAPANPDGNGRANSFAQAIERSLNPMVGRAVDIRA
ncbi:MAG: hypothetical protein LBP86_05735 [Azoarcus sp.]|jgi:hypothetical protein|nr:hypothetical protein [Azoarcus sp.]